MSNFVVNEKIKSDILNLYFKEKYTMQEISDKTTISRYTISKILHQDKRFEDEKNNRKEEKLKQPQVNKLIFDKNKNTFNVKVSIPYNYIEKLGLSRDDRIVEVKLDEKKEEITIKKHKNCYNSQPT